MTKTLSRSDKLITAMHESALKALAKATNGQLRVRDVLAAIENEVELDDWAKQLYESSGTARWKSIFSFSSVGMSKAGYVRRDRGTLTILPDGRELIGKPFEPREYLNEVSRRYNAWKTQQIQIESSSGKPSTEADEELRDAPEEQIANAIKLAHEALAAELIDSIKSCEPEFFERLVVNLLLKMGYGGSRKEAGRAVGRSGDGGIDGIINEDRLGLDAIYLQAKRWESVVGEGPIRDFKGALDAKGAQKGVFITTSDFTPSALEAARNSRSYKIVLINGTRLAELMIEHDLGVSVAASYQLKRIDSDFFAEE